jgi:hypothetical protein
VNQVYAHVKRTMGRYSQAGEHRGIKAKIQTSLPPWELNCFVKSFVGRVHRVSRYQKEPTLVQNRSQGGTEQLVSIGVKMRTMKPAYLHGNSTIS